MQSTDAIGGIILAAGRGTRMSLSDRNKVVVDVAGKPLIQYAVELLQSAHIPTLLVVGAHAQTVKANLAGYSVSYSEQTEQKGTGHAALIGALSWTPPLPRHMIVGYGDHMMFYTKNTIERLIQEHTKTNASLTIVVSEEKNVEHRYGRIIRNEHSEVVDIVEYKDATEEQRNIREFNAGLYCIASEFLMQAGKLIAPSPVTGELYITELVKIAVAQGKKVHACSVPLSEVGVGVNSLDDLQTAQKIKETLS